MYEKGALIEIGKQKWTRPLWNGWNAKFDTIAKADRFSSDCLRLAS